MMASNLEHTLADITKSLREQKRKFALVGGLALSFRAEVRFTRDVDIAVLVQDDADFEALIFALRPMGYSVLATVEHTRLKRLATVRLSTPSGPVVDLISASCGIEQEIVERATPIEFGGISALPVARAEELLAMKILSMSDRRLQDRIDARNLMLYAAELNLGEVEENLRKITDRGFHRDEDLFAKLDAVLRDAKREE